MYSIALGKKVANVYEEAKEMNRRGFVNETDLRKDFVEDTESRLAEKWKKQEDISNEYKAACKIMSEEEASAQVFSGRRCLSGEFDDVYDERTAIKL